MSFILGPLQLSACAPLVQGVLPWPKKIYSTFKRKPIEIVQLVFCNRILLVSFSLNFVLVLMIISFGIVKDFRLVSNGYGVDLN